MDPLKVNVSLAPNSGRKYFGRAKKIVSQLECTYENYSQKVNVEQISPEKYSLSVTPQKRGNHKLHIECDGAHICGSPILIFITIDPKKVMVVSKPKKYKSVRPKAVKKVYVTKDEEVMIFDKNLQVLKLPGINEIIMVCMLQM